MSSHYLLDDPRIFIQWLSANFGFGLGYSPLNMYEHSSRLFRGDYSLHIRAKLTSAVNHHGYIGFCCVY